MSLPSEEQWRPIPGWEGRYEVSDLARVRSVDHVVTRTAKGRKTAHEYLVRGRIRKQHTRKRDGYLEISLFRGDEHVNITVHQVVAAAFLGPRPEGMEVRHLDGDKRNCRPENLAYGTSSDNERDKVRHGSHHNAAKTHCPQGHPYDEANTYVDPSGGRYCNECRRQRNRRRDAWLRTQSVPSSAPQSPAASAG